MFHRYLLIFLLLLGSSCSAASVSSSEAVSSIEGKTGDPITIHVFDGKGIRTTGPLKGRFRLQTDITKGYYGAVFFTRAGFYPKAVLFRTGEKPVQAGKVSLKRLEDKDKGVLTGVVYTPARGGRLLERTGIFMAFKGEDIEISGAPAGLAVNTDEKGIYMVSLPEGEYSLRVSGKEAGSVFIRPGETVIKNIEKGAVLID